jgi:hypothetical protein
VILRADGDDAVIAIGQASHAWLSGQLARAWGNEDFPPPQPWEEVCLAAEQHDVGMAHWDLHPEPHPDTGLPLQFYELPRTTHLALWSMAPARLFTQSRHAALIVSLHGSGLYERYPPQDPTPEVADAVAAFLAGQRALQERLMAEVGAAPDDARRWQNLLACWDDASLALCQGVAERTLGGEPRLRVQARGDHHVLDPWPFAASQLEVRCEGRRLRGAFDGAAELHAALEHAPRVDLRFTLRPVGNGEAHG